MSTINGEAVAVHVPTVAPQSNALSCLPSGEELNQAWKLSKELVATGFLPKAINTPAKAVAVYLKGRELGLPFMQSMGSIHVIEGKPSVSAELMAALCFSRVKGFGMKIIQADNQACVIEYRRAGSEPFRYSYSMDDAKRAGLTGKGPWQSHPAPMLAARNKGQALRLYCPDATMGVYAVEELTDDPNATWGDAAPDPAPVKARPAAAAIKRDAEVKAAAAASVAEVLGDEPAYEDAGAPTDESEVGTEAEPVMSTVDRAEMLAQCALDEVLLRLAAMRAATKGERKFYELHADPNGAQRTSIVDAELLLSFREKPVNTWLDQIKNNSMAWGSFCRAIIKVSDSLGIEVQG